MTTPDRPAAAGVFIVRDPAICAALEQLLAPHRTDSTPADADNGSSRVAALMADAEARAAELVGDPTDTLAPDATIEQILDHVHQAGHVNGHALATSEAVEENDALTGRLRRTEVNLAHADREYEKTTAQLRDAVARIAELEARNADMAKVADLEARPQTRRPTVSALRLKDQSSFASLARRMEDQSIGKDKPIADTLRVAAGWLRREIDTVYGPEAKAS